MGTVALALNGILSESFDSMILIALLIRTMHYFQVMMKLVWNFCFVFVLGATTSNAQRLLLVLYSGVTLGRLGISYGMLGIEVRPATCKISTLPIAHRKSFWYGSLLMQKYLALRHFCVRANDLQWVCTLVRFQHIICNKSLISLMSSLVYVQSTVLLRHRLLSNVKLRET